MKQGYYIVCLDSRGGIYSSGVENKVAMQMKCFSEVFAISLVGIKEIQVSFWGKVCRRLPYFYTKREYKEAFDQLGEADFIYMRYVPLDKEYMRFIRKIHDEYPACKIIVEIPTYPYDGELCALRFFPYLIKDKYYRKEYRKYVDRFVVYAQNTEEIFGVKTIETMNGIDVKSISPMKTDIEKQKNCIDLIFVGHMQKSHGLERLIKGLKQYYQKEQRVKVKFHCVGDGDERIKYQRLVKRYKLEKSVFFYGRKTGEELEDIYNKCDVAVGVLGFYKVGIKVSSALKSREYLAKGIPIISGGLTDVFLKDGCDYHIDFPNDKSVIDIGEVVSYYQALLIKYGTKNKLAESIRQYAFEHIDNRIVLEPIISYISEC